MGARYGTSGGGGDGAEDGRDFMWPGATSSRCGVLVKRVVSAASRDAWRVGAVGGCVARRERQWNDLRWLWARRY